MAEILETLMLICFGFSWPISAYHNYRAKTAQGTSLSFMLLILLGYLAGITAKLLSHNYSYALIAYLFNLTVVFCNLLIYLRNRHFDNIRKKQEVFLISNSI